MKKKLALLFCFTFLFTSFYFVKPTYAASFINAYDYVGIGYIPSSTAKPWCIVVGWSSNISFNIVNGKLVAYFPTYNNLRCQYGQYQGFSSYQDAYNYIVSHDVIGTVNNFPDGTLTKLFTLNGGAGIHSGTVTSDNVITSNKDATDEYFEPTWWDNLKSAFGDVIDIVFESVTGFALSSVQAIDNWLDDLFTVKVGVGESEQLQIDVVSPTPVPPTPTPIPYQTVIVPDGNGGSVIQYKYINPSGTPIVTDQPPQQNVTFNNNDDNDFEYPYYDNPENKDNPFKFKIPWYLKLVLKHNDIDIDTLDSHYQIAQQEVQSEDVVEAVDEIYNGFQVVPTNWLLLIGAIASLPLFAALIHRFLQG